MYDYEKCRLWREANRYTRAQLSALTGYGKSSIEDFESGIVRGNKARPISRNAMNRYRLVLAAIDAGLQAWDFGQKESQK